ncbi:MAG: hypothetical protein LBF40_10285 [Deltaproteobacteria bacterium]|jgi:hypothetical protein|nr:hypothetical protein [Deltaproteobacteria bacterium]
MAVLLSAMFLAACQSQGRAPRKAFTPSKAMGLSIDQLNQTVGQDRKEPYPPDGVRLTGYVVSRYQGGPVGKELMGVSENPSVSGIPAKGTVYCLRTLPPGSRQVALGDRVTIAGFVSKSSAKDNIFLDSCQVLSQEGPAPKNPASRGGKP